MRVRLQVWHAHKLVCGPGKARPFRHPKLNEAELEIAQEEAFRTKLKSVEEHVVQCNILGFSYSTVLEFLVGAPKGSLLQVTDSFVRAYQTTPYPLADDNDLGQPRICITSTAGSARSRRIRLGSPGFTGPCEA